MNITLWFVHLPTSAISTDIAYPAWLHDTDIHSIKYFTNIWETNLVQMMFKTHNGSYFASIVNDTEVGIIFELLGFLEFWVVAQFLNNFLHKGFVCGFREPALLIQQSQDSWRTSLRKGGGKANEKKTKKKSRNEGGFETSKRNLQSLKRKE